MNTPRLQAALALGLLFATHAASAAPPAAAPAAAGDPWAAFIASGRFDHALEGYGVLKDAGYMSNELDAARCDASAKPLASALQGAPVSAALHRVAMLCAEARGDGATAERELAAIAALSPRGLTALEDLQVRAPVPVLSVVDAEAMAESAGLELVHTYYLEPRPTRYFPLVVIGRDARSGRERQYVFDYVDPAYRAATGQPDYGTPALRERIAREFVDDGVRSDSLMSVEADAASRALGEDSLAKRIDVLRAPAARGGVLAAMAWTGVCVSQPAAPCDGLVDALLTHAEKNEAWATALLALAKVRGVGIARDAAAGWALLDKAIERSGDGSALALFDQLHSQATGNAPRPPELLARLRAAGQSGRAYARRALVLERVAASRAAPSPADETFLAADAQNGTGWGRYVLARLYQRAGDSARYHQWLQAAAGAGSVEAQATLGGALMYGETGAPDAVRALALLREAGQGGHAWAARMVADNARDAGRCREAELWLVPQVTQDIDTLVQIAELYLDGCPGIQGNREAGLKALTELAQLPDAGEVRRTLARRYAQGRGVPRDGAKARALLEPDAERGVVDAQLLLAVGLLDGEFGPADRSAGMKWMERAVAGGSGDALDAYAQWLFRAEDSVDARRRAYALWERAIAAEGEYAANNFAWATCTTPHADAFDPARGLKVLAGLGPVDALRPGWKDTAAACHAANGNFDEAVRLQTVAATAMAALEPPPKGEADYVTRLKLYRARQRYVQADARGAGTH